MVVSVALEPESLVQLGAFEALLSASGASMALTEKQAWWATRSRLDSQLKVGKAGDWPLLVSDLYLGETS